MYATTICPIGLNFCHEEEAQYEDGLCSNYGTCRQWAKAWQLPLRRYIDDDDCFWKVEIGFYYSYQPFEGEIVSRNWHEYFAEYGFADAWLLPQLG